MKNISIVSWNFRCKWIGDGINGFIHRAGMILDTIDKKKPDIICVQEAMPESIGFLKKHLNEYDIIFNCREIELTGEGLAFLVRKDTVECITVDRFWLSPTPYVIGSRYENQSNNPRICQVGLFRHIATNKLFRIYNNHLDHISDEARILGMNSVLDRISEDNEKTRYPFFVLGDFNDFPDSKIIEYCDNYEKTPMVNLTTDMGTTYHGFGTSNNDQIDFIYSDKKTAQNKYTKEKWTRKLNGIYLSDHYPVCIKIEL